MRGVARTIAKITAIGIACVAVTSGTMLSAAAAEASSKTYRVEGKQIPVAGSTDIFEMTSNPGRTGLVGEWQTTEFNVRSAGQTWYTATGKEEFDGCVDVNGNNECGVTEPIGTLKFDYFLLVTKFDPVTFDTIEGRCVHPVTGGGGGFADAKGLITMHDFGVGSAHQTTYQGFITVKGGRSNPASQLSADTAPAAAGLGPAVGGSLQAADVPNLPRGC